MNGLKINYGRMLEGKNAVVTSGAHGMGRYTAEVLAMHGAKVAICGRDPSGEERGVELAKMSPGSFFIKCDLSKRDETDSFIKETLRRMGTVHVVSDVVGINRYELIADVTEENYDTVQNVNIFGAMRLARGFIPGMIKAGGGSFVHISTVHSEVGIPGNTSYASSKAAVNAFSCQLAASYGKYNVRSNVIAPGGIHSTGEHTKYFNEQLPRDHERLSRMAKGSGGGSPDFGSGSSYDIANTTLFLLSEMSRKVTGAVVMVDGGCVSQSHNIRKYRNPEDIDEIWTEFFMGRFKQPVY